MGFSPPGVPVFIRDLTMLSGCVSQLARLPCLHKAQIIASNTLEGTPALPSSPPSIFSHLDDCNLLTAPPAPILGSLTPNPAWSFFLKKKSPFLSLVLAALDLHCSARAFSSCSKRRLHCIGGAWASLVEHTL